MVYTSFNGRARAEFMKSTVIDTFALPNISAVLSVTIPQVFCAMEAG